MNRKIWNEVGFEHTGRYGTTLIAKRCDFVGGVTIYAPNKISQEHLIGDIMEIIAYHVTNIHPNLNGFAGYDCCRIKLVAIWEFD